MDIITIIISVAVGVVAGNLVQGVVNAYRIDHLMRHVVVKDYEKDHDERQCGNCDGCGGREECNGCEGCEDFRCSGEDDE